MVYTSHVLWQVLVPFYHSLPVTFFPKSIQPSITPGSWQIFVNEQMWEHRTKQQLPTYWLWSRQCLATTLKENINQRRKQPKFECEAHWWGEESIGELETMWEKQHCGEGATEATTVALSFGPNTAPTCRARDRPVRRIRLLG
jgi:hypothetical protein